MRKIDADYYIEFLNGMYKRAGWDPREIHMSLLDVISNLDNIPTIEEKLPDNKESDVKLVKVDDILEKSHDVILEGGAKHHCFDITRLFEIPTVDALVWTPVKDSLPVLTEDDDNEFLVTMRTTQSTKKFSLYYVCTAKYSENLHELSSDDFPEEKRSGWYNYDAVGGYFYDMEFKLDKHKREVVAWMQLPKPYEENK